MGIKFPSAYVLEAMIQTFLAWSLFTEVSSSCNWKQTSQSPASNAERIFCDCKFFLNFCFVSCCVFFFFCYWVKFKICGSEFHQFYILEKPQDYSLLQNCQFKCLHKIIELSQQPTNFSCSHGSCCISDRKQSHNCLKNERKLIS